MTAKPKLLLFQQQYNQRAASFLRAQQHDHVKCLTHFFDVIVVSEDCDYRRVCDKYQPELALFESGVNLRGSRRIEISNVRGCGDIPKLGFHNSDSWCETRPGFLSDMDHWGIEQYFSICTTMAEHVPDIASRLFTWPNCIDPKTYKDYGQTKFVPFFLSGCTNELYPWRASVFAALSTVYPSLVCPHPGYLSRIRAGQVMWGETYARAINASWFAPTCGTVAKEVIRKHFEFPGCKACLITEESAGLRAAGFVDMQNCVFADKKNILEKVSYLLENQDELMKIINAGYELVQARHTIYNRDQIFQWFTLNKTLGPDERIVQLGPFEPLTVVAKSSRIETVHVSSMGSHLILLGSANELLAAGRYDEAERAYLRLLTNMNQLTEPVLGIALCNLYKGNAKVALSWIVRPIRVTLAVYKAVDPDPVEWAYLIIALLGSGRLRSARRRAAQFPWLRHPELDRARWLTELLANGGCSRPYADDDNPAPRVSIHRLPERSLEDWLGKISQMLTACGQKQAAAAISRAIIDQSAARKTSITVLDHGLGEMPPRRLKKQGRGFFWQKPTLRGLDNPLLVNKLIARLAAPLLRIWRSLASALLGRVSSSSSNSDRHRFLQHTANVLRANNIKSVLFLGCKQSSEAIEILKEACKSDEISPKIHVLDLEQSAITGESAQYRPTIQNGGMEKLLDIIEIEGRRNAFDGIIVDSGDSPAPLRVGPRLRRELRSSRFVALADIGTSPGHELYLELLRNGTHDLFALGSGNLKGFAILGKVENARD